MRGLQGHAANELCQSSFGRGHDGRVERRADGDRLDGDARRLAALLRLGNGGAGAGQDRLFGRVVVGDAEAVDALDQRLDSVPLPARGGHGAEITAVARLDHEAATGAADAEQVGLVHDARRVQRDEFAIGMPRRHISVEAHRGENGQQPGFDRAQGRLGHVGPGQRQGCLGLRSFIVSACGQDVARQREAEHGIRLGHGGGDFRKKDGDVRHHLGILTALTGEDQRQLAIRQQRRIAERRSRGQGFALGQMRGQGAKARAKVFAAAHDDRGDETARRRNAGQSKGEIGKVGGKARRDPRVQAGHLTGQIGFGRAAP